MGQIKEEESIYEKSSAEIFDKVCISNECFERSQKSFMNDPMVSMQLFEIGMAMEKPTADPDEKLTKELTIKYVKEANDKAFELFKTEF